MRFVEFVTENERNIVVNTQKIVCMEPVQLPCSCGYFEGTKLTLEGGIVVNLLMPYDNLKDVGLCETQLDNE